MPEANENDTVKVHYTGKLEDGTVFDSSREGGRGPLEFTIGQSQVIPGFENAVKGMSPGEKKTERIPAENAYGEPSPENLLEVPKNALPEGLEPNVGETLQVQDSRGMVAPVVVREVKEDTVVLDANHPLAGKDLVFDIELVDVQKA